MENYQVWRKYHIQFLNGQTAIFKIASRMHLQQNYKFNYSWERHFLQLDLWENNRNKKIQAILFYGMPTSTF